MKAVVFAGEGRISVEEVPEPTIQEGDDAIVRVSKASICASDLHLLHGKTPGMNEGSVIGHEYVGTITEVGSDLGDMTEGSRVLGSFLIVCGSCTPCGERRFNHCTERRALGLGTLTGDLDGAQAEYVRVPHARVNLKPLTGAYSGLSDETALFGGDILATGFYAASLAAPAPGDTVAIVGAGPIGLLTAAAMPAATNVLLLDLDPRRVAYARGLGLEAHEATEEPHEVVRAVAGKLADVAVEAVGTVPAFKTSLRCVRDGARVAVIGVYGTERYEMPMGMVWIRGLEMRFGGMANVQAHWDSALLETAKGTIDPTRLITHRLPLTSAEEGYELFASKEAVKVVLEV